MKPTKKILVPVDFSEASECAAKHAIELAGSHGAAIQFLHVVETYPLIAYSGGTVWSDPTLEKQLLDAAEEHMEKFLRKLDAPANAGSKVEVFFGAVASRITAEAQDSGADLIIMSTHGRSPLEHFFLGSVTERVIRTAPCPILILPKAV